MSDDSRIVRILIADDEPTILEAYRAVLQGPVKGAGEAATLGAELFGDAAPNEPTADFEIVLCQQGEQAVAATIEAAASGRPFSVAFLDVRMPPGIDGIETAARIRTLDPDLNIVIVTAYADRSPRDFAQLVPPLDKLFYISKPFQAMELQQFALALSAKRQADRAVRLAHVELGAQYAELNYAYDSLVRAKEAAESAQRAKTVFLQTVSHELRTPLNAVLGFSELLLAEPLGPLGHPTYREYVDDIHYSGAHLLRIVSDLLDFSKIEADKFELRNEDCDGDEIVTSVVEAMRDVAEQAGITLRWSTSAGACRFIADRDRVRQILLNLLSNAIKFTPSGGLVTVAVTAAPEGTIAFRVSDNGMGIAADKIPLALAPFGQIDAGASRKQQGPGFGLALAKGLAEVHGGSLTIESSPRQGTTVTVQLPGNAARGGAALRAISA